MKDGEGADAPKLPIAILGTESPENFDLDLDLLKCAVLYSDEVRIASMAFQINGFRWIISTCDPGALLNASLTSQGKSWPGLVGFGKAGYAFTVRELYAKLGDLRGLSEHDAISKIEKYQENLHAHMLTETKFAQVQELMRSCNFYMFDVIDWDPHHYSYISDWIPFIKESVDPYWSFLCDGDASDFTRRAIEEGRVELTARSEANSIDVLLGTGFIARLPSFPMLPIDELLDLRSDLHVHLTKYRSVVSGLRASFLGGPFDQHAQQEIDAIYREDVYPAVQELRRQYADHSLVREVLKFAGDNIGEFIKGGGLSAAATVVIANSFELTSSLDGALGLTGGVAGVAFSAARASRSERRSTADEGLYYLYEVDRRSKAQKGR